MRILFDCADCGYRYKATWYEPNWLARRFYEPDHEDFHQNSLLNDYPSQWKHHGATQERERISEAIWNLAVPLDTKDASERDIQAMEYAIWQFKHRAMAAIKGEEEKA